MKKGDLVCGIPNVGGPKGTGVILGFSIDFLIHRYDEPEYRVLWQKTGRISGNVQKKHLRKITNEGR